VPGHVLGEIPVDRAAAPGQHVGELPERVGELSWIAHRPERPERPARAGSARARSARAGSLAALIVGLVGQPEAEWTVSHRWL
jgi:hypothetical protein